MCSFFQEFIAWGWPKILSQISASVADMKAVSFHSICRFLAKNQTNVCVFFLSILSLVGQKCRAKYHTVFETWEQLLFSLYADSQHYVIKCWQSLIANGSKVKEKLNRAIDKSLFIADFLLDFLASPYLCLPILRTII